MSLEVNNQKPKLNPLAYSLMAEFPEIFGDKNKIELGVAQTLLVSLLPAADGRVVNERKSGISEVLFGLEILAPYADILHYWYATIPVAVGSPSEKLTFDITPTDERFSFVETSLYRNNRWLCKIKFD